MQKYIAITKLKFLILSFLLSGIIFSGYSNSFQPGDSILNTHRTLTAEELIRGERLFYGLVYPDNRAVNCAACHNTRVSDTLNWNPDAVEISKKYLDKTAAELSRVLLKPSGEKMREVHKDIQMSPEDIVMVKGYMDELAHMGLKRNKPVIQICSYSSLLPFCCCFLLLI